jgi:hypothetical protein
MRRFRALIRSVLGLVPDSPVPAAPAEIVVHSTAVNEFVVPGRRTVTCDGFKVELDLSNQVLAVEAPIDWDLDFERVEPGPSEAPLSATLGPIDVTALVSASVLAHKAKIFDDGLSAAVELAAQEGSGRHGGKAALLAALGRTLAGADPSVAGSAQSLLLGAARVGQVPVDGAPPEVAAGAQRAVRAFLADKVRSTPVGFYTWSRQLGRIFQQDRMLQSEIDTAGIRAVASALRADPSARAAYEHHLRFVSRLTNPFASPDLRTLLEAWDRGNADAPEGGMRFFPPSVARETELIKKLFGTDSIPDGFVLADEMIRRIRSRELDLAPGDESGWYDYQTWALEALVTPERMPEGERLHLDEEYRKLLVELFKGLLTLTRETHVKQLEISVAGLAVPHREVYIDIAPALSAEPLVTFYLRRALGYRYIRGVLEDTFGPHELERLYRLTEAGPVHMSLSAELTGIETLFLGAHVSVSRELGLVSDPATGSDASANEAADRFAAWLRELESDPDLNLDLRAMVPVFYDVERRKPKVWAFLGWARRPITVSFARPPQATIYDSKGRLLLDHPPIRWDALHADLPYPVSAELYVDRILDRHEFRKLCDSCGTRSEILRHLDASAVS